jgi:hypothetical protein
MRESDRADSGCMKRRVKAGGECLNKHLMILMAEASIEYRVPSPHVHDRKDQTKLESIDDIVSEFFATRALCHLRGEFGVPGSRGGRHNSSNGPSQLLPRKISLFAGHLHQTDDHDVSLYLAVHNITLTQSMFAFAILYSRPSKAYVNARSEMSQSR